MIRFEASIIIHAAPGFVRSTYACYSDWHVTFPATIARASLIQEIDGTKCIRVDHKTAGTVMNTLVESDSGSLILREWKPAYDAIFENIFEPFGQNTRYTVMATLQPKGVLRLLQPFVKPLARRKLRQFVLVPLQAACERQSAVGRRQ